MMASHNVVFAIDVNYQSEELSFSADLYRDNLKQWILRVLLSLGSKYGFEKVRWGYRFFHSRYAKNASLVTRGTDFKELHEKAFSDFEGELLLKIDGSGKSANEQHRHQPSPLSCVKNTIKEILLDFQWDRPDITSPTKVSLRPRRSGRSTTDVSLADEDLSSHGKNVLFMVSKCPHSKKQLEGFLCNSTTGNQRNLPEFVLPKCLIDMIIHRKVVLHWVDSSSYEVNNGDDDYIGLKMTIDALQLVAGKVIPMSVPCLTPNHKLSSLRIMDSDGVRSFPTGSSVNYILSSDKTYKRAFPALMGTLYWGAGNEKLTCSVLLEPVSCVPRHLCAPLEVTLRSVLYSFDTSFLAQYSLESWVLLSSFKSEKDQAAFQFLLKELSIQNSVMLAEVTEGDVVHSAVLSILSSNMALLTVIQSLESGDEEVLDEGFGSLKTTDMTNSTPLPDVVSSILSAVIKDKESLEGTNDQQVPEWATQEVQQWTNLKDLTERWFLLSDQSGISCNLMESMRLLHAAPENQEQNEEDTVMLTHSLVELYQNNRAGPNTGLKGKKSAQRTPVRQKMKSMSRSLQMLNFARFSVKAQKSQSGKDSSSNTKETEKRGKRRSAERTKAGPKHFKNEKELLSHLKLTYQQAVEDRNLPLIAQVQDLLLMVKAFNSNNDTGGLFLELIKKDLLKSTQHVRQLYGSASDVASKIRDCQLQIVLRLELCKQPPSDDPGHAEQMVEEMAGMLRIISLTYDPVYLSKFMQEEVLPLYLNVIPKILADIYHSLGTQLPEALVAVLPSDFFSDDSIAKASVSVSPAQLSATPSQLSSTGDRLEDLRNRSAKKRRNSILTRHKSMTEAPQVLRQIEMPRKSTRQVKPKPVSAENVNVASQPPQKQAAQEVTKVRRNLFNQETMTLSKKGKMPRSQSVSAVEGIKKRKRSQVEERHTLLPNKVSETPLHKQVSNRLLHRQRSGRRGNESDMVMVEESPVRPATDVRRSPRIKKLARRHSTVFYSSSQPRSRNLDRALSSSQLTASEGKGHINIRDVKSPMRLLFGAAESPGCPSTSLRARSNKAFHFGSTDSVFEVIQTQNYSKTPSKSPYKHHGAAVGRKPPKRPSSNSTAQSSSFLNSPSPTVGGSGITLRRSPFRSPATKTLMLETPKKSPLKGILRTPVKSFLECGSPSRSCLRSPNMRTPRKSVTWSPSPQKHLPEKTFKVPESPQASNSFSPNFLSPDKFCKDQFQLFKTPEKSSQREDKVSPKITQRVSESTCSLSPGESFRIPEFPQSTSRYHLRLMTPSKLRRDQVAVYKTPEKSSQPKSNMSPVTPQSISKVFRSFGHEESKLGQHTETARKTLDVQVKGDSVSPNTLSVGYSSQSRPEIKMHKEIPEQTHRLYTRSGRTPLKQSATFDKVDKDMSSFIKEMSIEPPSMSSSSTLISVGTNYPKSLSNHIENQTPACDSWITKDVNGSNISTQATLEEASSSDTQLLDSSQFSGATTEESIDITEASVIKTELTGGLKMNISFSRKSSISKEVFEFSGTQACPAETTRELRYGFRQTPDRQQRKAAARLGYSSGQPVFSTPHTSRTDSRKKATESNPLTYQVELEMQASGLPKLKFKRTDSFNSNKTLDCSAKVLAPQINIKASRFDGSHTLCIKHQEHGCISPSSCTHETPGKGGVQTYICQAVTPTRLLTNSPSPVGPGEPWTPSPQSLGRSTPENFRTWPRKKRARTVLLGTKENGTKEDKGFLEDPELDGVFRLLGAEEIKDLNAGPAWKCTSATASKLCSSEKMDWSESVGQESDKRDSMKCNELWISGTGSKGSVATPPHTKAKKPVSASGIFALTQSPLLYKGKKPAVTMETTQSDDLIGISEQCSNKGMVAFNVSPFSQPRRHQRSGRTYSRKRLLDS